MVSMGLGLAKGSLGRGVEGWCGCMIVVGLKDLVYYCVLLSCSSEDKKGLDNGG